MGWLGKKGLHGWLGRERGKAYPEEGAAGPGRARQFHRRPKTPVQHVVAGAGDLGYGDEAVLGDAAAHPQLQAGIAAQDARARRGVVVVERVGDDVAKGGVLAVGPAGGGGADGVVLRLPVGVARDVGEVQEVGFQQVGVQGRVDGVAAFAVGAGGGGEEEEEEGEERDWRGGGHGVGCVGVCGYGGGDISHVLWQVPDAEGAWRWAERACAKSEGIIHSQGEKRGERGWH